MKYRNLVFFDTEFEDNGRTVELISIGLVNWADKTYYAEVEEYDWTASTPWLKENVMPHLTANLKPKHQIAKEIIEFVGPNPEFWAYFSAYDWLVLCQLYGPMIHLPKGWPFHCMDIQQELVMQGGIKPPKQQSKSHFALADAQWNKEVYDKYIKPKRIIQG